MNRMKEFVLQYPQIKKKNKRDNAKKPRVIVVGRTYNSNLCMVRSLGEEGYEVEVLRVFLPKPSSGLKTLFAPEAYSKYVKGFYVCISDGDTRCIKEQLLKLADTQRKILIVPTDDCLAAVLEEYYEELSQYFILPNVNQTAGELLKLMSKEVQKKLAVEAGFTVAESCLITIKEGGFIIPDTVKYPCIIKPNSSKDATKNSIGVCYSYAELHAALTKIAEKSNIEILVEEFISVHKEYSILGVSAGRRVVVPGGFVVEDSGHNERRGVAISGKVGQGVVHKTILSRAQKLVAAMNYEGLFDIDLLEAEDGTIYFIELNLRYGGSGYAITASGLNLPGMFADYVYRGIPVDIDCVMKPLVKTFINERVLLDEYRAGYLTFSQVRGYMKNADICFMKNKADMWPYYWFYALMLLAFVKKKFR